MIEVLIGLVALAFPFAAIIGLVMAVGTRNRVSAIELRFAALDRRFAAAPLDGGAAAPPRLAPAPEPRATAAPHPTATQPPGLAEPEGELAEPAISASTPEPAVPSS